MKIKHLPACTGGILLLMACALGTNSPDSDSQRPLRLWYDEPASNFAQALPLGNGRQGAMVFGDPDEERIVLNEISMWSGSREDSDREDAHQFLPEIQRLLVEGKNIEAQQLLYAHFTCKGAGSGRGSGARVPYGSYQTLGNLRLTRVGGKKSAPIALSHWRRSDTAGQEAIQPGFDDQAWDELTIQDGKVLSGDANIPVNAKVVFRAAFQLTGHQIASGLGSLYLGPLDDTCTIHINGKVAGQTRPENWAKAHQFDVSKFLKEGRNVIALVAGNIGGLGSMAKKVELRAASHLPESYLRDLDLQNAIASVSFLHEGATHTREIFVSAPDQAVVIHLDCSEGSSISFETTLDRPERFETSKADHRTLLMRGQLDNGVDKNGMKFAAHLRAVNHGGTVSVQGNSLCIENADSAVLFVTAATDYTWPSGARGPDPVEVSLDHMDRVSEKKYQDVRTAHVADHRIYFDRVSLALKGTETKVSELPTDERLLSLQQGGEDPGLMALYFQYGRYLLIGSSRPGGMPANLQGLWAERIQTPWNGDYHLDINVQMNYWPAEVTNLSDLHEPMLKLIESLQEPGRKTAKAYYDARGWVAHVITNVWGFTSPGEHGSWGSTVSGSAWLCQHLWQHYAYNPDLDYLAWAYPIMKGSAEFYSDMLIEEPGHGWLVTAPSNSPENAYILPDGRRGFTCMGPTMDQQIVRELFGNCIRAAEILGKDEPFRKALEEKRRRLAPNQIGKHGQLQEWLADYDEAEPHHRHVSHLYGLHPSDEITPDATPELAEAAKVTLERRGDAGTGWSLAWKVNFWARLRDGNRACKLLRDLLRPTGSMGFDYVGGGSGTYANLFCAHPPFQIDGNFGGTAGIAEMLLQSHGGIIRLLPALPDAWPQGNVTGLCARGGAQVDMAWKEGRLIRASILPGHDGTLELAYGGSSVEIKVRKGEVIRVDGSLRKITG